jgi:hypothetical protein
MIQLFKSLFGEPSRGRSVKKSAPIARPKPTHAREDYRAVSLAPSIDCCTATRDAEKRYLSREAPQLPLAGCTMPAECSCRFRKHSDRRDGERRVFGDAGGSRWFTGSERRIRRGRRSAKN